MFTDSPKIDAAYNLREDLTALFERDDTKAGAKRAMQAWVKRVQPYLAANNLSSGELAAAYRHFLG